MRKGSRERMRLNLEQSARIFRLNTGTEHVGQ